MCTSSGVAQSMFEMYLLGSLALQARCLWLGQVCVACCLGHSSGCLARLVGSM